MAIVVTTTGFHRGDERLGRLVQRGAYAGTDDRGLAPLVVLTALTLGGVFGVPWRECLSRGEAPPE